MIKVLLSDYDGVLFPDEYRGTRQFCPDEARLGRMEASYYSQSHSDGLWDELRGAFHLRLSNEKLSEMYNSEEEDQRTHERMLLDVYLRLKQQGIRLFLLSNQIADRTHFLRKKECLKIFDGLFFSSELGMQKPQPELFRYVLQRIGYEPAEVLFVDDLTENTDAATRMGIQTHAFHGIEEFTKFAHALV